MLHRYIPIINKFDLIDLSHERDYDKYATVFTHFIWYIKKILWEINNFEQKIFVVAEYRQFERYPAFPNQKSFLSVPKTSFKGVSLNPYLDTGQHWFEDLPT